MFFYLMWVWSLTGSLVDFLKTTEGGSLPMITLIDMASQVKASLPYLSSLHYISDSLTFHLSQYDPHKLNWYG